MLIASSGNYRGKVLWYSTSSPCKWDQHFLRERRQTELKVCTHLQKSSVTERKKGQELMPMSLKLLGLCVSGINMEILSWALNLEYFLFAIKQIKNLSLWMLISVSHLLLPTSSSNKCRVGWVSSQRWEERGEGIVRGRNESPVPLTQPVPRATILHTFRASIHIALCE